MMIYFTLLVIVLFLGFLCFYSGVNEKRKKVFLSLSFFCLFSVMALRSPAVGTDNWNYSLLYLAIGESSEFFSIIKSAPVYSLYNKTLYLFFPFRQAVIVANALIICICVPIFIYNFSRNVVYSTFCYVALYFYLTSFNATRQFIAISLMLIAVCFIYKGKFGRTLAFTILAVGVHNLSLVAAPFLFLIKGKINKGKVFAMTVFCLGILVFFSFLFEPLVNLFVELFPRYQMYLGGGSYTYTDGGRGRNILLTFFYLAFVLVSLYYVFSRHNNSEKISKNRVFNIVLLMGIIDVTLGLAAPENLAIARLRLYFSVYMICLIPNSLQLFGRYKSLLYVICAGIMMIPFTIQLMENISGVVPYQFFWE